MSDDDNADYGQWIREQDADVIPFPLGQFERMKNERESALDDLPVRSERSTRTKCEHRRSTVNERDRTVNCRDCGVALDPIHVLASLAQAREYLVQQGRSLRIEKERLSGDVEKLKRDEKNTKARLRNAEHPTLKEARLALKEASEAFYAVSGLMSRLGVEESDSKLYRQVSGAWHRCRQVAEKLKPKNAAIG